MLARDAVKDDLSRQSVFDFAITNTTFSQFG